MHDDPSPIPTAYVVAIFVVVFVITLLGLQAYFGRVASEEQQAKLVAPRVEALEAARREQQARISDYRWVDADSGRVALPIERAMELVAAELAAEAGSR